MDEQNPDAAGLTQTKNKLQKLRAIQLRAEGWPVQKIADELGVQRQTVSVWLNSRDVKQVVEAAMNRFKTLLDASVDVYALALSKADKDMTNAQRAARDVLKTYGIVKDTVDVSHQFPKATVIKRSDGTEVVLGAVTEKVVEGKEE